MPVHVRVAVVMLPELIGHQHFAVHKENIHVVLSELRECKEIDVADVGPTSQRLRGADALLLASPHAIGRSQRLNPWLEGLDEINPLPSVTCLLGWGGMLRLAYGIHSSTQDNPRMAGVHILVEPYIEHLYRLLQDQGVFRDAAIASGPW